MADQQPPADGKGKGGKLLGMPRTTGLIVIAGGVALIGYVIISHFGKSSSSGSSSSGNQPTYLVGDGAGGWTDVVNGVQGSQPRQPHHHRRGEGPEREWLERKTGSEHPWSFLQRHDERVVVGPDGSRTIVHEQDRRRRRHR